MNRRTAHFLLLFLVLTSTACSSPTTGTGSAAGSSKDGGLQFTSTDIGVSDGGIPFVDSGLTSSDNGSGAVVDSGGVDTGLDDPNATGGSCKPGSIIGLVCAPKQGISVSFASVTFDANTGCSAAKPVHVSVTADAKGKYSFVNLPPGPGTLTLSKGSFQTVLNVTVPAGGQLDFSKGLDPTRCFQSTSVKIAVLLGDADHIEKLLDLLGFAYDAYDSATGATSAAAKLLGDPLKLQGYDVVFANCGTQVQAIVQGVPTAITNLKAFVLAGHSLYASDWAWAYVEWAFPDAIEFHGVDNSFTKGSGPPSTTAGPRQGPGPTLTAKNKGAAPYATQGALVDPALAAVLGKNSTTIQEDLGTWAVMQSAGAGTVVSVQGPVKDSSGDWGTVPMVVTFPQGKGRVVYTSFHNIAQTGANGSTADIQAILTYLVFTL